jgi:hypothetical protein
MNIMPFDAPNSVISNLTQAGITTCGLVKTSSVNDTSATNA